MGYTKKNRRKRDDSLYWLGTLGIPHFFLFLLICLDLSNTII
jgi:hypothetical protein